MTQYVVYSDDLEKLIAMGKVVEHDGKYLYDGHPLRVAPRPRRPRDTTTPQRPEPRRMNRHETRKAAKMARIAETNQRIEARNASAAERDRLAAGRGHWGTSSTAWSK